MLEAVEAPAEARQDPSQALRASQSISEHLSGFRGLRGHLGWVSGFPKGRKPAAWKIQKHSHLGPQLVAQPVSELVRPT